MIRELRGVDGQALPFDIVVAYFHRNNMSKLMGAVREVPDALHAAARIFKMLGRMTADGFAPEEAELGAVCELVGKALEQTAERGHREMNDLACNLAAAIGCTDKRLSKASGQAARGNEEDRASRERFVAYLHKECGEDLRKAEEYVSRLQPNEVGRAHEDRRAAEGMMAHLGIGARSALAEDEE